MIKLSRLCSVALLALGLAFAQGDNTSINGLVTDPSGAAVPNAKVSLRNDSTGATRETTTTSTGTYVIPSIPSGTYTLSIEVQGFRKFETKGNKIDANLPATINAAMQVGQVSDTITVEATVGAIQTETSTLGKLVEGKQVSDLQLNGRNPLFLALLKPGVRGGSLAGFSFGLTSGGLNINGSRSQDNLITFDGAVGVRTRSNGTSIGTADLDAVQEVQILTANYGAEYGRAGGGQIRIITKTGGQQFHGALYEYLRNSELNANSWSRNRNGQVLPSEKFNQFGWNLNGPIFIPKLFNSDRSKVFFFVGQEWVRQRTVASNTRVVPTTLMKQGNFSELLGPNNFFSTPRIVRDPTTGNPFPNNVIPSGQLSRNGLALLSVYPDPNLVAAQGRNNWFGQAGAPVDQRKDTYSLDVLPTQTDFVKFRMNFYHFLDINPFQTQFLISARTFDRPNQTASLNWTKTINATTVNEFLVTASRDQVLIRMQETAAFDRNVYGINYPYIFPDGKDRPNKLPTVDIANFQSYSGSPYPSNSAGPIYVISNNTTKVLGRHTLKFGVLFERAGQNDYDQINVQGVPGGTDNQNGRFVFTDTRPGGSGTGIADAALGLFNTYAEIGVRSYTPYRGHMMEWFFQDSWRATDKLKIELGIRQSFIQPYYSLWRNMSVFDPTFYDPAQAVRVDPRTGNPIPGTGDPYNGVVIPGKDFVPESSGRIPIADTGEFNRLFRDGVSKEYSQIQKTLFQPRIGIAYQINEKTVVRSGIGRFSTRLGVSDSIFLGGNPPFQPLASIPNGRVDNPGGGSLSSFPLSINTQDPIFKNPESWNWNFTVEREIGFRTVIEGSYVGRKGLHAQRERNLNQLLPGTIQANPGVNENFLRPYSGFGPIRITNNEASSFYQAFQLGVNRRFASGLSYGFAYTYSKSTDDGSTQRSILPNAFDASYLWGPSNFDNRQTAVINFIYELPFLKSGQGIATTLLGGWQVSGVVQFQTGTPFSVFSGSDDFAGVGTGSGNPGEGMAQYWRLVGDVSYPREFTNGGAADPASWITGQFVQPTPGTFVTDQLRNQFYHPGFQNWNLSAFKNFRMKERFNLQFRADAFNWLNHPNLGGATGGGTDNNPRNGTFGKVTNKGSERNIQLGLRFSF